jgi:DNA primase catalytic subunit
LVASLGLFSLGGSHIFFTDQILLFLDGKHPGCDQSYVRRREFSFTLENDIYLRFQSFDSAAELESSIKEKCPFKIDIGPVYSIDV